MYAFTFTWLCLIMHSYYIQDAKITQVSQVEVFSVFLTLAVCFNFDSIKSNRLFVKCKKLDFACYLSGDTSDLYLRGIQFKSCKSINIPD